MFSLVVLLMHAGGVLSSDRAFGVALAFDAGVACILLTTPAHVWVR